MTDLLHDIDAPSDAELISRVRGGDVAAYGDLFARHVDAARRLARQLVRGSDADDLVSDAFTKVLGVLQNGGGPDVAFRAYLLTAVRRLHIDKIRAGAKLQTSGDMEAFDPGVPFQDTAVAAFESGAAAKAFASLPERWQLVLWHLEVEGQKPADIAPLLGMSANSVSALAYRAREGLRQAFLTMHLNDISDTSCRWVNEHLGGYVRNGLSKRDAAKVQSHLDECRRCTAMYLELTEVNSNLRGIIAPLLLGAAAAGYLSATGAAGGGFSLVAFLDRARDAVTANAGAATAGAVAAGVAAAATAGILLLPSSGPNERVVGADDPIGVISPGAPGDDADPGEDDGEPGVADEGSDDEAAVDPTDEEPVTADGVLGDPGTEPVSQDGEPGAGDPGAGDPGAGSDPGAGPGAGGEPGPGRPGEPGGGPGDPEGPGGPAEPGPGAGDPGTPGDPTDPINPGGPAPGDPGGGEPGNGGGDPGGGGNPGGGDPGGGGGDPGGGDPGGGGGNPDPDPEPDPGPGDPVSVNVSVGANAQLLDNEVTLQLSAGADALPLSVRVELAANPPGITFGAGGPCQPSQDRLSVTCNLQSIQAVTILDAPFVRALVSTDGVGIPLILPLDIPTGQESTELTFTVVLEGGLSDPDPSDNVATAKYVAPATPPDPEPEPEPDLEIVLAVGLDQVIPETVHDYVVTGQLDLSGTPAKVTFTLSGEDRVRFAANVSDALTLAGSALPAPPPTPSCSVVGEDLVCAGFAAPTYSVRLPLYAQDNSPDSRFVTITATALGDAGESLGSASVTVELLRFEPKLPTTLLSVTRDRVDATPTEASPDEATHVTATSAPSASRWAEQPEPSAKRATSPTTKVAQSTKTVTSRATQSTKRGIIEKTGARKPKLDQQRVGKTSTKVEAPTAKSGDVPGKAKGGVQELKRQPTDTADKGRSGVSEPRSQLTPDAKAKTEPLLSTAAEPHRGHPSDAGDVAPRVRP